MMAPRSSPVARYGLSADRSIALPVALLIALLTLGGCPTRSGLSPAAMDGVQARYRGETFFLKQSLYFGAFYSDKKRKLVDAREFDQLRFMTSPDGDIIIPAAPEGILPAGAKVEVVEIAFPTSAAIARRPLFTPRYNVWVILRVGRYAGDVDFFHEEEHILVLGSTVRTEEAIQAHLDAVLSREDLSPWLAERSESARLAINEKRAQEGLTFEELVAAKGFPDRIERRPEDGAHVGRATYGETVITLVDDVVREISRVDEATSAPARQPQQPAHSVPADASQET